jgi:hypothetical protein
LSVPDTTGVVAAKVWSVVAGGELSELGFVETNMSVTLYGEPDAIRVDVDVDEDENHPEGVCRGNGAVKVNLGIVDGGDVTEGTGVVTISVGNVVKNVAADPGGGVLSMLSLGRTQLGTPCRVPNAQSLNDVSCLTIFSPGMSLLPPVWV